jgi:hypothetical protein
VFSGQRRVTLEISQLLLSLRRLEVVTAQQVIRWLDFNATHASHCVRQGGIWSRETLPELRRHIVAAPTIIISVALDAA